MNGHNGKGEKAPNPLLVKFTPLLKAQEPEGPILDLACGAGQNGLFLAGLNLPVILADRSREALEEARRSAEARGLQVQFWEIDLETGENSLQEDYYRTIMVFRYLHRPLMPSLRQAIRRGGILIYETFTIEQPRYGRPHNPDFLLRPGELAGWFEDWEIIHSFEGLLENPTRAMAQLVCRKPA
ncbi:MAG: methyltransferase domain-containing protein [Syntrophus sp. (in: bacteria)]|nr:methyltransferase domain-containing protein [Syntrophus sp. (in: bacteria)]